MENNNFAIQIRLGDKLYNHDKDGNLIIGRITKMKNSESVEFTLEDTKEKLNISKAQLLDNYTKLRPDGYINFAIVNTQNDVKDLMITLYRRKDLDNKDAIPYAVCRQNVMDVFINHLQPKQDKNIYIGLSINKDNVPENISYNTILACNGIVHSDMISIYIDDTEDIILSLVKHRKYDEALCILNNQIVNPYIQGKCTSLVQLVKENKFIFDFCSAFDILKVEFELEVTDNFELYPDHREALEDMIKCEMFKTYVLEYKKDINLKELKREYKLVSDINNKLYVVAYDEGKYINRYYRDSIQDKRDAAMLLSKIKK